MENKVPRYLKRTIVTDNISRNMEDLTIVRARLFGHISVGEAMRSLYQDVSFTIKTLTSKTGLEVNLIKQLFLEPKYHHPSIPVLEITLGKEITLDEIVEQFVSKFILTMSPSLNHRDVVEYPPLSAEDPNVIIQAVTKYKVYTVSPEFMKNIKGE